MILFNFTGLRRFYWLPDFQSNGLRNRDGLWYASIKWLGVEVTAQSVEMATEFIRRLNAQVAAYSGEQGGGA